MSSTQAILPDSTCSINSSNAEVLYAKCATLANNLWWAWHPEVGEIFRDMDPIRWRQLDHNPVRLLQEFTAGRLETRAAEMALQSRIHAAYRQLNAYLASETTWGRKHAGVLNARPIAYFSAEFGIHESIPIYSHEHGLNAGEHLKGASDLGVPLVAFGLFYAQGYFRQRLDEEGLQVEEHVETKPDDLPVEQVFAGVAQPLVVRVPTRSADLNAHVWLMRVGRTRLYLLDSDVPGNLPEDRSLTGRLLGGDERSRIRQQLLLGVGGVQVCEHLGLQPGVLHLNDAPTTFAPLAMIRARMESDSVSFDEALHETREATIFTSHVPVGSRSSRYSTELVEEHLGPLRDALGVSIDQLMGLGRVEPQDVSQPMCAALLGLKLSSRSNGSSSVHGQALRRAWSQLWPWRASDEIPIGHITQGVHVADWIAAPIKQLFDRNFPPNWFHHVSDPEAWRQVAEIDSGELWETLTSVKGQMLAFVRRRLSRQCRRRGECDDAVETARHVLRSDALTIGCAGLETGERADLIFADIDRLCNLLNDEQRPIQLIFAGRALPTDDARKCLIQRLANARLNPRFDNRMVFIEDYDLNVCRHLVQGVDVWLSHPRRRSETLDVNGQRLVVNGGLNCATLDGWWAEAFDGQNGFAIGGNSSHVSAAINDQRDADALYDVLESQVIPAFYQCDKDGLPTEWLRRVKHSIASLAWRFNAARMVADYTQTTYLPAAGGTSCQMH